MEWLHLSWWYASHLSDQVLGSCSRWNPSVPHLKHVRNEKVCYSNRVHKSCGQNYKNIHRILLLILQMLLTVTSWTTVTEADDNKKKLLELGTKKPGSFSPRFITLVRSPSGNITFAILHRVLYLAIRTPYVKHSMCSLHLQHEWVKITQGQMWCH